MAEVQILLLAVAVEAPTRKQAYNQMSEGFKQMGPLEGNIFGLDSWWVAEDDRTDRSDNDSAVFCHPGAQHKASLMLAAHGLSGEHNILTPKINPGFHGVQI